MQTRHGHAFTTPTTGYGLGADGTLYPDGCPTGSDGVNYPAGTGPLFTPEGRAELGIVDQPAPPRPDDRYYFVHDDGSAVAKPVETLRDIKLGEIAAARYALETGGIEIAGMSIRTDRESQAQLSSAYASLLGGLIPDTPWKAANGWVNVTLAEVQPIAQAVAAHVRDCFGRERQAQLALTALGDDAEALIAFDARAALLAEAQP